MIFIKILLNIVFIVLLIALGLISVFGIYEEIMGPVEAEKLLKTLRIPLTYTQTIIIGIAVVVVTFAVYHLIKHLSGKI